MFNFMISIFSIIKKAPLSACFLAVINYELIQYPIVFGFIAEIFEDLY